MTIKKLLINITEDLKKSNIENYLFEAKLILCNVLNVDNIYITLNKEEKVLDVRKKLVLEITEKRKKGWPLQYLLGSQEFMSLNFKVDNNVLIPRQDTETLIEHILSLINESKSYNILEVGTGSGCISVSLAYYIKNSYITAIDISEKALKIAKENAELNNVENKINFKCKDIFEYNPEHEEYDFIVSNPPYIPTNVINNLNDEVKQFEPYNALDGGHNGLLFYPRLIDISSDFLKTGGYLAFEVGHDQAEAVINIINKKDKFKQVEIIKDLCGVKRVVSAKKTL